MCSLFLHCQEHIYLSVLMFMGSFCLSNTNVSVLISLVFVVCERSRSCTVSVPSCIYWLPRSSVSSLLAVILSRSNLKLAASCIFQGDLKYIAG